MASHSPDTSTTAIALWSKAIRALSGTAGSKDSAVLAARNVSGHLDVSVDHDQISVRWFAERIETDAVWAQLGRRLVPMPRDNTSKHFAVKFTTGAGLKYIRLHCRDAQGRTRSPASALIRIAKASTPASVPVAPKATTRPTVSIIVPNFNHAPFLRQRLESIYWQTYPHFEVILLDDCSTDQSRDILAEYLERYPEKTRLVTNTQNSGGPFRQWAAGIRLARGDLVWIAESDDWCEPDFLQTLVPLFDRPDVLLAHALTRFVDGEGRPMRTSYDRYVGSLSRHRWRRDHIASANEEVVAGMGIRNTVPNASAALFRKPTDLPLLENEKWLSMRTCGDWVFYLHRMRGGSIAFTRRTRNYYRNHSSNTSLPAQSRPDYYREHEQVAVTLQELYAPPAAVFEKHEAVLRQRIAKSTENLPSLNELFSIDRILRTAAPKPLHVLVCCHGFVPGGAESFAISLAIRFRTLGCTVTFADFEGGPEDTGIRIRLPGDIPVVHPGRVSPRESGLTWQRMGVDIISTHHWRTDLYCAKAVDSLPVARRPALCCTHHGFYHLDAGNLLRYRSLFSRAVSSWVHVARSGGRPFRCLGVDEAATGVPEFHIPAGISLPAPKPVSRAELNIPEDAFVLCLASRAIPDKGWRTAIEAVRIAREQVSRPLHLLLAGNGPVYDELMHESLPGWISLLGHRKGIPDIYASADIGLLPSTYPAESCPLTLIECLAVGTPVVATDVGDIKAMLTTADGDRAGTVVPAGPSESLSKRLAGTIATFASDHRLLDQTRLVTKTAAARFDINACAEAYLRHFEKFCRRTD